jgi:acetyl esterase/lipase
MHSLCDRRSVLTLGAIAAVVRPAKAQTGVPEAAEIVPLWPGQPPGDCGAHLALRIDEKSPDPSAFHARWVSGIASPSLSVFRPDRPDGSAILVVPGGGYEFLSIDNEGIEVARRLTAFGVTVFVLLHRLPREGWAGRSDVPLQDAQRAMRLIRANAARFNVDPARIGVLGFSAGGHVAACLATRAGSRVYDAVDVADTYDAAPAFAGLMYPVITMAEGCHTGSRDALLGSAPSAPAIAAYSCERLVSPATPPCFICLSARDDIVPYRPNGLAMYTALCDRGVSAELHVFQDGKHGFGARAVKGTPPSAWPELLLHWGYGNGWFRDPGARPS